MSKKVVQITVNAKQASEILKRFDNQFKSVNKSIGKSNVFLGRFQGLIAATFSIQALRGVTQWSDQMKLLGTRINTFKRAGESSLSIQQKLLTIQRDNGLGMNTMLDGYTKISAALQDTTFNTQTSLDVLESASLAFRVFGVNAQQADSALLQLSQGLASGRLAGDEFKSVAENASILLDFFSQELGVNRGQLKELAAQGRITGDVIVNALVNNLDDLREKSKSVPLTIDQITNSAKSFMAEFVDKIEKKTGVFTLTGKAILLMAENIEVFAGVAVGVAIATIPLLVKSITTLNLKLATNPFGLLAIGISTAAVVIYTNWEKIKKAVFEGLLFIQEKIAQFRVKYWELQSTMFNSKFGKFVLPDAVQKGSLLRLKEAKKALIDIRKESAKYYRQLKLDQGGTKSKRSGNFKQLDPLTRERERADALKELNLKWDQGKITLEDYTDKLRNLNTEYYELFSISDQIGNGLEDGFRTYAKSVSNLTKSISSAVKNSFTRMEDSLVDFVKTGKLEFKSLVDSILTDILRITLQKTVTAPLANAFVGSFSSGGGWGSISAHANATGNAFNGGSIVPFAKGGAFTNSIVSSPTYFPMSGSRTGLMGEAGPEAIMPLTRIGGSLGVKSVGGGSNVQVNIINNSGAEIETSERQVGNERIIEVMIHKTVNDGLTNGTYDKAMGNSYGAKRRGTA